MSTARKGDLVIIEQTHHDYIIGQPTSERTSYRVALVASATRDGLVKTYRGVGYGDELISTSAVPMRHERCFIASAADVDVDATLRAAKAHHWPGHPGQPKDFDSIADVRAIVAR